jgi:hypothetical protein
MELLCLNSEIESSFDIKTKIECHISHSKNIESLRNTQQTQSSSEVDWIDEENSLN